MLNPTDTASAAALSFPVPFQMPTESPLSKLVEHCNKFGSTSDSKMKLEPVKADALLLPTDMNAYSPYLSTHNWLDQTNWHHLYPAVTAASAADTLQNYFAPASFGGFLTSSVSAVAAQSAALSTQSALSTAMATQQRSISKPKVTSSLASSSSVPSSGNAAGGKYQATRTANKCECPNCQEAEKFGPNAIAARKRGVHNCHIAGCGKVYNKSSHLKAHLRWHSGERQMKRRSGDNA